MEITQTNQTIPTSQPVQPAKSQSAISSDFETFLQMLTAQMNNQDPLNPIDSADYAVQLATFSNVEQQVLTNDLLTELGAQFGVMGMSQMAGWVGMEARAAVPANFNGTPITLSPNPASVADRAVLVVHDKNGIEVQRTDFAVSKDQIDWAGVDSLGAPLPNGLYSFSVESYAKGEHLATSQVEVYSKIREARNENGTTALILDGGARVAAADVTALRDPE